jgi:(R,R)-butanediol dehydrogenase/meso-butanediol dehydrogenase/diacetyl reductase
MSAAVYQQPRTLAVESWPVPEPGPGEVVLRVSHCGVCGTDLHLVMEGWGQPRSIGGHEYSGTIAALGAEVEGWEIGEAVVGGPEPGCGDCDPCRAHRPGLCVGHSKPGVDAFQGAFAEYKCVDAAQLLRIPKGLPIREAALCEPLAVALHGITLSRIRPGQRAFISGAGPIGALTLAALRARGIEDVEVSEPAPVRRKLAARLGASRVHEPSDLEVPVLPFDTAEPSVAAAFECSGHPDAFPAALARVERMGTLVIVGTGMRRPKLDANRVLLNELTITGAYNYDETGFADALDLLASGKLPTDLLIDSNDVALGGLQGAMERLFNGEIGGKVMVAPQP